MKRIVLLGVYAVCSALAVTAGEPLTLARVLALAAQGNPDAALAQARIEKARAQLGQAEAAFQPRVVLGGSYAGSSNGATLFAYRGQQASIPNGMDFNHPPDSDNLNVHLTALMPLYTGGQSTALREAARAGTRAAEQSREAVMLSLDFEVARAFFSVQKAGSFTAAVKTAAEAYSAHLELAQRRHAAGSALKTDVLDLEVRLAAAQADVAQAQTAIRLATAALKALLGMEQEAPLEIAGDQQTIRTGQTAPAGHHDRAEVRAARELVLAAQAGVRAAQAGQRPRVNAFATVEENAGVSHDGNQESWTAGLSLEWDIFDGRLTRHRISAAKAELRSAQEEERRARLAVSLEAEQARLNLEDAQRRLAVTEKAIAAAAESAMLTRARYEQGAALVTQLMDAESALVSARVSRAQAEADRLIANAAVKKAEGRR